MTRVDPGVEVIAAARRGFRKGYQDGVLETLAQLTGRFTLDPAVAAWAADVKGKVEADRE